MSIYQRNKCAVPDCVKLQRNKGFLNGKRYYGRTCDRHHRKEGSIGDEVSKHIIQRIDNKECEVCGWSESYCDRHRLNPKLGYTRENIKVLCPNCHRLATVGLLNF